MKRNISWRDLPRFKIDEEQKLLYWDDEVIHTSAVLHLSNKQGIVALIVSVATILSAIFSGITTFGLYTNKEDKERQDTYKASFIDTSASLKAINDKVPNGWLSAQPIMKIDDQDVVIALENISKKLDFIKIAPSQEASQPVQFYKRPRHERPGKPHH